MITEFKVNGIHCHSCVKIIQMDIEELKGIKEVKGDEKKGIITVTYDNKLTNANEIAKKIEQDGYKVTSQKGQDN